MSDTLSASVPLASATRIAPVSQLGRTALLIHLLSLGAAIVAIVPAFIYPPDSKDITTFMAVIGSASFALNIWSIILAVRAISKAEPHRWPLAVLAAFLLESSAVSILGWGLQPRWNYEMWLISAGLACGAPVFVPFFSLLSFVTIPMALKRARGAPNAWQYGLKHYFLISAALTLLLLPLPLFMYCLSFSGKHWDDRPTWQSAIAAHTPDAIRDFAADHLDETGDMHLKMLAEGWMSNARLETYSRINNKLGAFAVRGLLKSDRDTALKIALLIADGKHFSARASATQAAEVLCKYAPTDIVRKYLKSYSSQNRFAQNLISQIGNNNETRFVPDLERLVENNSDCRLGAMHALARLLPPDEIVKRWPEYLANSDWEFRLNAAEAMYNFRSRAIWLNTALAALARPERVAHRAVLNRLCNRFDETVELADRRRWVQAMLSILEDTDLVRRRGARAALAVEFKIAIDALTPPTGIPDDAPDNEPSEPESSVEHTDTSHVTAAARRWLDQPKNR